MVETVWFLMTFALQGAHSAVVARHVYDTRAECHDALKGELAKNRDKWGLAPDENVGAFCVEGIAE